MAPVAGRAEHAAGVVATPVVATVGAEEYVVSAAAMLSGAGAPPAGMIPYLERDQVLQEPGKVDGQLRLPLRAAVGAVLGREPVEPAVELAELPFDMDLARAEVVAFQADRFAPPQAFSGGPKPVARRCTRRFAESFCNTYSWVWCSLSLLL